MGKRTGPAVRVCAAALASILLAGCGDIGGGPPPPGSCPDGGSLGGSLFGGGAEIEWVPFVVVAGVMLSTGYTPEFVLREDQVGAVVATVACRIDDVVRDPAFEPRDGDAAYLPVGTQIHAVVGFTVTSRVAAREDGVWRYYRSVEASPSP